MCAAARVGRLCVLASMPLLLLLSSCSTEVGQLTNLSLPPGGAWAGAWEAPPENATVSMADNFGGSEQSFRSIVIPTVGGGIERLHFSNRYGTTPLTLGTVRLAVVSGTAPATDPTRTAPVTFSGGQTGVTIPAGQDVVSDPVRVQYAYGERLAVSVYMPGTFPALTLHAAEANLNWTAVAGTGDVTADSGAKFSQVNTEWYLLSGVDVYGSYQGTVVLYGSSSIDGHASSYGNTNSYPVANVAVAGQDADRPSDWLARQLQAAGYNLGVLNAGIAGDPAGEDARTMAGPAVAGVDRMQKDVLEQAGVKAVVIYFGGIDLRSDCVAAPAVEASLTNMVGQAHAAGVRVILATLPPSEYCQTAAPVPTAGNPYAGDINPGPENPGSVQRRALNQWIKTTGAALPGVVAIADFDAVLADPAHPDFMIPNLNSGDNFHPNGVGYGVQSGAIPLKAILGQ